MAEQEVQISGTPAEETQDTEMGGAEDSQPVQPTGDGAGDDAGDGSALPDIEPETAPRATFLDYLKSPMVELAIGPSSSPTILTTHQALLVKSPYFASQVASFTPDQPRRIDLPDEDIEATGSFLEYLYMDEYFPKRLDSSKDAALEPDPRTPARDDEGSALLRHARVYTIAEKFGMPTLKSLAHSKIHRTSSTARGEIAYARYVYKETSKEDATIRRPVAAFWATRSHVLRHEAEDEFRAMCLEFPQFAFDVLSLMLDNKEKKAAHSGGDGLRVEAGMSHGERSARKRARVSQG